MQLTPEQIEEFTTRGVIIARGALTHDDQQPLIDELSEWIDARAHTLHKAGKIDELHEGAPFETRYGLLFKQCPEIGQGMDIMHYRGRAIFEFAAEHRAIILTHSGEENSLPEDFVPFANDYPEVRLILAHIGCTIEVGRINGFARL